MSQSELLRKVVFALDASVVPYMLTGSYASSLQGEPRLTHDIDLVVQLELQATADLAAAFPPPNSMKLRLAEMSGGSVKQLADVKSVYELQRGGLDIAYIERWVGDFRLQHLWMEIVRGADPDSYKP